jgi:hypothetical protein
MGVGVQRHAPVALPPGKTRYIFTAWEKIKSKNLYFFCEANRSPMLKEPHNEHCVLSVLRSQQKRLLYNSHLYAPAALSHRKEPQ